MTNLCERLFGFKELDIQSLERLMEEFDITLEEPVSINYNAILYEVLDAIANKFFQDYKNKIMIIFDETSEIEAQEKFYDSLNIFTNYTDYSIWFEDDKLNDLYQTSEYLV